jgi:hypothetical protein
MHDADILNILRIEHVNPLLFKGLVSNSGLANLSQTCPLEKDRTVSDFQNPGTKAKAGKRKMPYNKHDKHVERFGRPYSAITLGIK